MRAPAGALADHEERALEGADGRLAPDEELPHHRHRLARDRADGAGIDGHVAPADHPLAVVPTAASRIASCRRRRAGPREKKHIATP